MEGHHLNTEEDPISECRHLWIIDSPNGPVSRGTCKTCGISGEFKNSMPVSGWDRSGTQKKRPRRVHTT